MEAPIPDQWRFSVATILKSGPSERIITTVQSHLDWQAAFPDAWDHDRFEAMAEALETEGVIGRLISTMSDPGDTYAFWFTFRNKRLYAKVNLSPEGRVIIVYSSHAPRKGDNL